MIWNKAFEKYSSPSVFIRKAWPRLKNIPGGNRIFSVLVGKFIPYTGSISPLVEEVDNGTAVVSMVDRAAVRNHLNSIHAIALANLGEFTTGLSVLSQLHKKSKAILVHFEIDYIMKARGQLRASCFSKVPDSIKTDTDFVALAEIKNQAGDVVAKVAATWRIRF
jgi:acyl-coenzyme A thioesterase PaaI-like protein